MQVVASPEKSSPLRWAFFVSLFLLFPLLKSYQNMILEYDIVVLDKSY